MEHTSTTPQEIEVAAPPAAATGSITTRVELPSGGWAEISDPRSIRAKHRKRVMDTLNMDRITNPTAGVMFDMSDGLILMMVEKWSIPYLSDVARPLDDVASIDELEIPDYDAIVGKLEHARHMLFPSPATVDGAGKPGSPTPPANG